MKIIDRYLIRDLVPPFFLGIFIFTFVLLMSQILRLMELIVNKGVSVGTLVQLIFFLMPSILVLALPMSVFLSSLVTFGRWSAENELTALKSGGISLFRLSLPVFLFSFVAYLATSYIIISALPSGNQAFRKKMFEIVRTKANIGLREKVFIDDFPGLIIYANTIPQTEQPVMEGLIITDYRPAQRKPPQLPLTIIAEKGWLVPDENIQRIIFRLQNGSTHSLSKDLEKYQKIDFRIQDLQITLGEEMLGDINIPKGLREMNLRELREKKAEFQKMGVKYHAPEVEIQKKFALPFAALIFGFLGLTMGSLFRRGEKLVSFAISIAIAIVYYIFLLAGEPLGKQGKVHPILAMWSANIFFMVLTLYLFRKALTEKPFTVLNRLRRRMLHLPLAWFYGRMRPR